MQDKTQDKKIRFYDFKILKSNFICKVKPSDKEMEDELAFDLKSCNSILNNDDIACALATLCGNAYSHVEMELEISAVCYDEIKNFLKCELKVKRIINKKKNDFRLRHHTDYKKKYLLSFSGGFDSLAALALLPAKETALVSIDFGGWFEREREFFENFSTNVLTTNFRKLGYANAHWTFMGVGAILYYTSLKCQYHIFGTILEAAQHHFLKQPSSIINLKTPPISTAGLTDIRLTNGLTEVGTAMLVTKYYPDLVHDSLLSLAAPLSEKRYRKQILTEIVCERYNRDILMPELPQPNSREITPFGTNFAKDFLSLYEIKHKGLECAQKTLSDIPDKVVEMAGTLKLDFYERLNSKFLEAIPEELKSYYMERLKTAGIVLYDENDWMEFEIVRTFLSKYYSGILG